MRYLFELGHQPHISQAEIETVLADTQTTMTRIQRGSSLLVETEETLDCTALQEQLGGTVMIRESIGGKGDVASIVTYLLETCPEGKIHFSLSGNEAKKTALAAKKEIKAAKRSVRYIEPKNSATVLYNGLLDRKTDLYAEGGALWVTRSIQQFHKFKERDYDRPATDTKSGMLPPKLARILVNLSGATKSSSFYEPFCGSGTALVEALSLGIQTIQGSDNSDRAVTNSIENIEWYKEEYPDTTKQEVKIFEHDIQQPITQIPANSVTCVATEPYMGKPLRGSETKEVMENQTRNLRVLYIRAFTSLLPILTKGAVVIFIIPAFKNGDEWVVIDCLDEILDLGYEIEPLSEESDYLRYHRTKQFLARDIWKFRKV